MRAAVLSLVLGATAAIGGDALRAQSNPTSEARDLIQHLTARSSTPPIAEQAILDAASPEICRAIGEEIRTLQAVTAARLTGSLARSVNANAHAALLIGLTSQDQEIVGSCLKALSSLEYRKIRSLKEAAQALSPGLLDTLVKENHLQTAVKSSVTELCSLDDNVAHTAAIRHQQIALMLLVDLYGGSTGAKNVIDQLIEMMVGKPPEDYADLFKVEEAPKLGPDGKPDPAAAKPKVESPETEQRRNDMIMMHRRREQARDMYQLILARPAIQDQLGESGYTLRKKAAAEFWQRYTERTGKAFSSWREHLVWAQRNAELPEEKMSAMLLMDHLLGGVEIDPPEDETPKDKDKDENLIDGPVTVPIFKGANDAERGVNFDQLRLSERRRRRRHLEKMFIETFCDVVQANGDSKAGDSDPNKASGTPSREPGAEGR